MRYAFCFVALLLFHGAFLQPTLVAQDIDAPSGGPAAATPADASSTEPADDSAAADDADTATDPAAANGEPAGEDEAANDAAEAPASSVWSVLDEITSTGPIGMIRDGGIFMYPILLLGILAAGVIIERYRSLKMLGVDSAALRERVRTMLQEDLIEEALKLCDESAGPAAAVLSCGLRKYLVLRRLDYDLGKVDEQVVKSMEDYSVHIVAALERHLPVLATISSVAPMLGFLGTVSGMITSFTDIKDMFSGGGGSNIVEAAASGISVALLTTCFGLIVGIPSFMAYNYFTSVINRFVLEVEESSTELIESVTLQMAITRKEREASRDGQPDAAALQLSSES